MSDECSKAIKGPKDGYDTSDRLSDCECDIEQTLFGLMETAVAAGWTRAEVAIAVTNLADNYLLSRVVSSQTAQELRRAITQLKKP